jgi:nicotinamide-nucleotide amidase
MPRTRLDRDVNRIAHLARAAKLTFVTVASCTVGALANALSEAEGASDFLHGGFVVYTKANKVSVVGVPEELIAKHTAVSVPVAKAMVAGALRRSPADIAIAITGVAGPDPDEDGNPVGLTYLAAATRNGHVLVEELRLSGSKSQICEEAMSTALRLAAGLIT